MSRKSDVTVGVVILLGIALVVAGTMWLSGVVLGREEEVVQARFREVGQLLEGNSVKVRGVPIGQVESIELAERGDGVIVSLRIDSDVVLPPDPVVILAPESMFGDWQAEIFARSQFPRYQYAESPDPQILPGYSLPDISRLTAVADRIAENLAVLTERIEIAFTEETALRVREAIENIQAVSSELTDLVRAQERTIEEVGANLQTTSETLNQAALTVQRTFGEVESAIGEGELAEIVDNIRATSAQLEALTTALAGTGTQLQSAIASIDSVFDPLEDVVSAVARGEGTLGRLVQDTALYAQVVRTNMILQTLLADIQANPRKYINLQIF